MFHGDSKNHGEISNGENLSGEFGVIVVGGGHAGLEAALICAKMGVKTLLITTLIQNIALASCNPAIGGLGKGHLVKEVDALGGAMGILSDACGLQYRVLNASKGPAVRGSRAQIDMDIYSNAAKDLALNAENLSLTQEMVEGLILESVADCVGDDKSPASRHCEALRVEQRRGNPLVESIQDSNASPLFDAIDCHDLATQGLAMTDSTTARNNSAQKVIGVRTNLGNQYRAKCVIITTGTFLNGLVHIGENKISAGRIGELPSIALADSLKKIGLKMGRLKTGTCPRIDGRSIDKSALERHFGDENPPIFSHKTARFHARNDLPCFVTYTNENTHKIIRENFHRAPMFTGQIKGTGPRYCPSIEDKVSRFADKERHQLFLEPQSASSVEYYINGLSTSLPNDVQRAVVRSIKGLENARITRFGYAIEYDFVEPTELTHALETKKCANLFLAGQINGTTGYEEAAAQGIMAGINAALRALNRPPFTLRRDEAYIGVMIDDLVTKGTSEPYRVFTSRAEFRLLLREDNALFRLGRYAHNLGLLDSAEFSALEADARSISSVLEFLKKTAWTPSKPNLALLASLGLKPINDKAALIQILSINEVDAIMEALPDLLGHFGYGVESKSVAESKTDSNMDSIESKNATESKMDSKIADCKNAQSKIDSKRADSAIRPALTPRALSPRAVEQIAIEGKYANYIAKQEADIARMKSMLNEKIPSDFDFNIKELGLEAVEKLNKIRPATLFAASEISGITPANIEVLQIHLHLRKKI